MKGDDRIYHVKQTLFFNAIMDTLQNLPFKEQVFLATVVDVMSFMLKYHCSETI